MLGSGAKLLMTAFTVVLCGLQACLAGAPARSAVLVLGDNNMFSLDYTPEGVPFSGTMTVYKEDGKTLIMPPITDPTQAAFPLLPKGTYYFSMTSGFTGTFELIGLVKTGLPKSSPAQHSLTTYETITFSCPSGNPAIAVEVNPGFEKAKNVNGSTLTVTVTQDDFTMSVAKSKS